jgi:hypothetical protein
MKAISKLFFTTIGFLCLMGCNDDFLDIRPLDEVTNENFWANEAQLKAATYPCYDILQKDLLNLGEGTAESAIWGSVADGLNKVSGGQHSNDGYPISTWWSTLYNNIYLCNVFLDNYNRAATDQAVKDRYAAEVKVLRAYDYFLLTSLFGDVPLITKALSASDPELYGARTRKSEIVDLILADLDWAASKLLATRPTGANIGRVNKWWAVALKARIALYNEKWQVAADAAKEVMSSNQFELYSDYKNMFRIAGNASTNTANKETIMYGLYVKDLRMHNLSGEICKPVDYIRFNASKSLVDAYLGTDGKPAVKGYEYNNNAAVQLSAVYDRTEPNYANYWSNRDPRMGMTILKPGDSWTGGNDGRPGSNTASYPTFTLPRFAGLKNNNRNGANSMTGFYFTKYCDPAVATALNLDDNDIVILRYAEVLLTYAEAKFKLGSFTQEVADQTVNLLRQRVGMHPMILSELTNWGMDLETELRRERRIELAFEGQRLFDIYRWKEGDRLGKSVTGPRASICITSLGANPYKDNGVDANGDIIYERSVAEGGGRNFNPAKHYLWPIPNGEILKNPKLTQNPGW